MGEVQGVGRRDRATFPGKGRKFLSLSLREQDSTKETLSLTLKGVRSCRPVHADS